MMPLQMEVIIYQPSGGWDSEVVDTENKVESLYGGIQNFSINKKTVKLNLAVFCDPNRKNVELFG